jgi:hypothetical protein
VPFDDPYQGTGNPFPEQYAPFSPARDASFTLPLGLIGNFDPAFRPSYQQVYNLTVEREFGLNLLARVSYVGNLGRHLPYSVDTNYARFVPGASTTANIQSRRPFTDFGQVLTSMSEGTSSYHALQMSLERRFSALSFEANYTWSKAIDEYSQDATPGQSASLSIPYSRWLNRGVADFDVPHRFVVSAVWALPVLSRSNAVLRAVAGGWEASSILTARSGLPFSVFSGRDNSFSGVGRDSADLIGDPYLSSDRPRGEQIARYFNPAAYITNAVGTFGTAPRNHLRGPGAFSLDAALMKRIPLRENLSMQFRAEFFNALNNVNLNNPFATQNNAARFGRVESAGDPRIIQLALKVVF